jgi:heptosyltransferase-3
VNYLINRTDALGDNILTMPVAQVIKEGDPQAKIAIITSPLCAPLYENHPYIDEVFLLNKNDSFWSKLKQSLDFLGHFKADYYFYIGGTQLPSLAALLKGVPFRGGILSRWPSFLTLNKGMRQKRSRLSKHEMEFNFDLLAQVPNLQVKNAQDYMASFNSALIDKSDTSTWDSFRKEIPCAVKHKDFIVIHPGMTGHTLNWPSSYYAQLIVELNKRLPQKYNYFISHTPSDERFVSVVKEELKKHADISEQIFYFNGAKHGLTHYMQILKHAKAFVGPSTGTLHIAATLGVPVVGIFSPIKAQSVNRWGPKGSAPVLTFTPQVSCEQSTKCIKEECQYYECMSKIEVTKVTDELIKVLKLLPLNGDKVNTST